ncbi:MAG: hypothetical protein OJF49_001803 [Ktedonobacterales bacterium]|jgi:signal transduction histidine kinase|nr:MAG: hypothetical protein OJF49_001803 [Ktedonobacterales bacterium]
MRRFRLSTLLVTINVALLLFAVAGVALVAVHLLQQLADEQSLARVAQAGVGAQHALERSGDDTLTAAQVLAERPTLKHLIETADNVGLVAYLDQYRQSSHLDGCAVLVDGRVFVASGAALPWATLQSTHPASDAPALQSPPDGPLLLSGWAAIPTLADTTVLTAEVLNDAFAQRLSAQIALPVAILDRRAALASASGPRAALRARVLATGMAATARLDAPADYIAIQPVRDFSGNVIGVMETLLPSTSTTDSLRQLVQTLLLLAMGVSGALAAISFIIGRRMGAPLFMLTKAAARIGEGDLTTPIRPEAGAEIGTLAASLEEMRGRLLTLTGDLRRQQAESEAILTGVVEGVFTVDRERRMRYLNPQMAALLGIAPDAALGRFCGDVLNPQRRNGVRPCEEQCPIVQARFRGAASATEHLCAPDGSRRTVVITSAAPVEAQQVQVLRDETEVEATRRLRDTVLANISHEFKTPLAAQLASIELLLDQLPDLSMEQIGQLAHALQRGSLRLTQLIDNLLESVRIEAGKDSLRRQAVALEDVVEAAVDLTRPLLELRGQEVAVELPYPLPPVSGDAARLTQVFVNLLANANKFAPAGTTITIGGAVGETEVALWVEDAGPGLPMHAPSGLFERFVRAEGEEPEQGGVGLGLWIVKSIVERHGGRVAARNRETGGTRISVMLPVERRNEDSGGG